MENSLKSYNYLYNILWSKVEIKLSIVTLVYKRKTTFNINEVYELYVFLLPQNINKNNICIVPQPENFRFGAVSDCKKYSLSLFLHHYSWD